MNITLILVVLLLLYKLVNNRYGRDTLTKRILLIYVCWWVFCLILSSFGFYGFKPLSTNSTVIMLSHLFFFLCGYMMVKDCGTLNGIENHLSSVILKLSTSKVFNILIVGALLYVMSLYITFAARLALTNSMADVRNDYYGGSLYGNMFSVINGLILSPLNYICLPVFSYTLLRKPNFITLITGLFLVIYASLGGGRLNYAYILLSIIYINYCLLKINIKKMVLPFAVLMTIAYFGISYVTAARYGNTEFSVETITNGIDKTNEQLLSYAIGSFTAYDYAMEHNYVEKMGGYQYGRLTGASFEALAYTILGKLGIHIHKSLDDFTDIVQNNLISISDNMSWNALYTSLLYYYCDAGLIGVIVVSVFFGVLLHVLINQLRKFKTFPYIVLLGFFFQNLIYSTMSYGFTSLFALLFVLIMIKVGKIKSVNR